MHYLIFYIFANQGFPKRSVSETLGYYKQNLGTAKIDFDILWN